MIINVHDIVTHAVYQYALNAIDADAIYVLALYVVRKRGGAIRARIGGCVLSVAYRYAGIAQVIARLAAGGPCVHWVNLQFQ